MELHELRPKTPSFTIAKTGNSYQLRPFTIADRIWMTHEYGSKSEDMTEAFADPAKMCHVIYRQIVNREDFKKQSISVIDESGNEIKVDMGGVQLLAAMITAEEYKSMVQALSDLIMQSENTKEDAENKESVEKKILSAGPQLSTESLASTAGL